MIKWPSSAALTSISDAAPLTDRLSGIDEYLKLFTPDQFEHVSAGDIEIWQTNWKLAIENAVESYHLFKVHERTLEQISPTRGAYYVAGSSEWSITGGSTGRKKDIVNEAFGGSQDELYEHYLLVALAPSFVGVLTYGSFGWLSAHPLGSGVTQIRSGATMMSSEGLGGGANGREFTQAFFAEDQMICERVYTGMESRISSGGKLVDMERVVVDFHQYWGGRLGQLPPTERFDDEMAQPWLQVAGMVGDSR